MWILRRPKYLCTSLLSLCMRPSALSSTNRTRPLHRSWGSLSREAATVPAAFSVGVLQALHQNGLLNKVEVISAVSGGSYALSWLQLLQPFYYALADPKASLGEMQDAMLDANGRFQRYLENHAKPLGAADRLSFIMLSALAGIFTLVLFNALRVLDLSISWIPGLGERLAPPFQRRRALSVRSIAWEFKVPIRCCPMRAGNVLRTMGVPISRSIAELLTLSRARPPATFPQMRAFSHQVGLPSFVFNTTVRTPRMGVSESLRHCIFEIGVCRFRLGHSCGFLAWEQTDGFGWEPGMTWKGFDDESSPFATLRSLNTAPAISGAAISDAGVEQEMGEVASEPGERRVYSSMSCRTRPISNGLCASATEGTQRT